MDNNKNQGKQGINHRNRVNDSNIEKWTLLKNKPYDFVPLIAKVNRKNMGIGHSKFEENCFSGKIKLKITIDTPVHIGSGLYEHGAEGITKLTMRRNKKIIIPGSSLKGIIRSIAESISASCAPNLPFHKNVFGKNLNGLRDGLEKNNIISCNNAKSLCTTCRMFGMAEKSESYKSKVVFSEFKSENVRTKKLKIRQLQSPFRDYKDGYRDILGNENGYGNERIYYCQVCKNDFKDGINANCYECKKDEYYSKRKMAGNKRLIKFRGRKFYYHSDKNNLKLDKSGKVFENYEFIEEGTEFYGYIVFENLREEELSLLLFSLGIDGTFSIKLGYGKPLYFGSVKIELEDLVDYMKRYSRYMNKNKKYLGKEEAINLAKKYFENCDEEIKKAIIQLRKILDINKRNGIDWGEVY